MCREFTFAVESGIVYLTMSNAARAKYGDLVDAWWETAKALEAMPGADAVRVNWHAKIFERILAQCGWTVEEWNVSVATEKNTTKGNS